MCLPACTNDGEPVALANAARSRLTSLLQVWLAADAAVDGMRVRG
jgi:hypothetical protein